jgi:hypothetical protein
MITVMMQAANAGHSYHFGGASGPLFDHPESWRLLLQGIVNAIVVIIREVISKQPTQVGFVQDDHVVQQFPSGRGPTAPRLRLKVGCKVKIFMRRNCNTSTTRRGARGSVLGLWVFAGQPFPAGKGGRYLSLGGFFRRDNDR